MDKIINIKKNIILLLAVSLGIFTLCFFSGKLIIAILKMSFTLFQIVLCIYLLIRINHQDKNSYVLTEEADTTKQSDRLIYLSDQDYFFFKALSSVSKNKNAEKLAMTREAQFLALQNQINPHFLYNALESIRSDALSQGAESVAVISEALASFFRYSISNLDHLVEIEEEIDNVQNYFYIQKYRFGSKINIVYDYDRDDKKTLKYYMPKLIIQPIVENAIYHGIENKMGSGLVIIKIECTEKNLDIVVSDDGIGIDAETLNTINKKLNSSNYSESERSKVNSGIALLNVNQRIKILFGSNYGLYIDSIVNIGTDVHIKLPLIDSEKYYFKSFCS